MNISKAEKNAREILRELFQNSRGLEIYGTKYPDLETFRRQDRIGYREIISRLVWDTIGLEQIIKRID